jgi:hypothetical protein
MIGSLPVATASLVAIVDVGWMLMSAVVAACANGLDVTAKSKRRMMIEN